MCGFITFIKWLLGLLSIGFISYGTYYIVNKQDDISCANVILDLFLELLVIYYY